MDMLACLALVTVNLIHDIMLCELIYYVALGILPDPGHVMLDIRFMTLTYGNYTTPGMLHQIYDFWHRHLVFTPAHDIWHRYLPCYIWHWYLPCYMWYVIPDTGTCHAICDMWYPTPVLVLLHLSLDIRYRYLICRTWLLLLIHGICYAFMWYKYLDLTSWLLTGHYHPWYLILWHIHDYHYYGDMTWLLYYYYQIFGTPELLYSCILEPLK